jgi:hypothetical protein
MLAKHPVVRVAPVRISYGQREGVTDGESSGSQVGILPDKLTDWEAAVTDDPEY